MLETWFDLFKAGARCGVLPKDILDMNLVEFQAVMAGYSEHMYDHQEISVHTGYWAGYYSSGAKRKKPVKTIIEKMEKARHKSAGERAPDVDVDAFLEKEKRFREAYEKQGG